MQYMFTPAVQPVITEIEHNSSNQRYNRKYNLRTRNQPEMSHITDINKQKQSTPITIGA